jgi:iron complex outermembrane receptor protein
VKAISDGYSNEQRQNRTALFAAYSFNSSNKKFQTTIAARQEIMQQKFVPFVYSFGAAYKFSKWVSTKCSAAKIYRVPTMNDLYWNPGGNPDLKPESGYSTEAGLLIYFNLPKQKINFSFEPTVFNKNIDNWILWLPGISYWSPQNIMQVWSRGMETRSELRFTAQKFSVKINVMTNYVLSTNEKIKLENDASLHKLLIYTPMYSGHAKITLQYKKFSLSYLHKYVGYRYTSADNTEFLTPYNLANVYAAYQLKLKNYDINFFAEANNIFNQQYQVLLNRAMPLVNYQAGFSIQFHQNKQSK